jgi:hypothetical protein
MIGKNRKLETVSIKNHGEDIQNNIGMLWKFLLLENIVWHSLAI